MCVYVCACECVLGGGGCSGGTGGKGKTYTKAYRKEKIIEKQYCTNLKRLI